MSHHDHHGSDDNSNDHHHSISNKILLRTLIVLLALTVITVAASRIDLGQRWNFVLAMFIASGKALLVTLFFMGLKYDNNENRGFFYSSIFFLAAFIVLTAADIFTRSADWRIGNAEILKTASGAGGPTFTKPWEKSEAMLAHAKKIYDINCAVCHGAEGKGDGPGSALPKKPRNFHEATGWVNERKPSAIYNMFLTGVPPFMPPYAQLSPVDRWALTHFVLSFGPPPAADDAASLKAVGVDTTKPDGGLGSGDQKKTIPVDFALERYLEKSKQ